MSEGKYALSSLQSSPAFPPPSSFPSPSASNVDVIALIFPFSSTSIPTTTEPPSTTVSPLSRGDPTAFLKVRPLPPTHSEKVSLYDTILYVSPFFTTAQRGTKTSSVF